MKFENELKIIKKGVEEIIPLDELVKKLEKSEKTGKPLRIKYGIDPTGFDVHIGTWCRSVKCVIFRIWVIPE
jgi:tyrosyl-tRNA synthetase